MLLPGIFPVHPAGLATAVLRRATAFARAGVDTILLIDQFSPDLDSNWIEHQDTGRLDDGTLQIRYMHTDLAGRNPGDLGADYGDPCDGRQGNWTYKVDEKRSEVTRAYLGGDYLEFILRRENGRVNFIDRMDAKSKKRVQRTWFDHNGLPIKIEYMDAANKPVRAEYLRRDGSVYMREDGSAGSKFSICAENGAELLSGSYDDIVEYWLRKHVFVRDAAPAIIAEYGFRHIALARVHEALGGKLVYTMHGSHLAPPYTYGAGVRGEHRSFLERIRELPALVVLTEEQRRDLCKEFGPLTNVHVIPHHATFVGRDVARDPYKIVMVGRFDKNKGHAQVLSSFSQIRSRIPKATLDLYGRGPERLAIEDQIAELGLGDAVRIVGHSNDVAGVYAGAAVSLVASGHEGFCLALIESMSQGCVPVTYRFKYGPQDIVKDGTSGFVVERGNVAELADSASLLLEDASRRLQMSSAATEVRDRFSEARLIREWSQLLQPDGGPRFVEPLPISG